MPPIDPTKILFDTVSNLTGGLITDLQTLIVGVIVVSFIVFAIDILLSAINAGFENAARDRNFERAQDFLDRRNQMAKGTASWDYYNLKYRNALRKSI